MCCIHVLQMYRIHVPHELHVPRTSHIMMPNAYTSPCWYTLPSSISSGGMWVTVPLYFWLTCVRLPSGSTCDSPKSDTCSKQVDMYKESECSRGRRRCWFDQIDWLSWMQMALLGAVVGATDNKAAAWQTARCMAT